MTHPHPTPRLGVGWGCAKRSLERKERMKYEVRTYTVPYRDPRDCPLIDSAEDAARVARDVLARGDRDRDYAVIVVFPKEYALPGKSTPGGVLAYEIAPGEVLRASDTFRSLEVIVCTLAGNGSAVGDGVGVPMHDPIVVDLAA